MTKDQFTLEVSSIQRKLNDLLMGAYIHGLDYHLQVNSANCVKDDQRKVIGISIHDPKQKKIIYKNDGVP